MRDMLLVGGGGHCKVVIDVIERTGVWRVAGIVESVQSNLSEVLGYPVVGTDDDLPCLYKDIPYALVSVGQIKTPAVRQAIFYRLKEIGYSLPVIVSPFAHLSHHATIGEGSVVMDFACVNAAATVGVNCIINTRALVEHDCRIGNHCHIATTATLNGNVVLGDGSFVGSGSIVREGISIGQRCLVGMGAVVRHSLHDDQRFVGGRTS